MKYKDFKGKFMLQKRNHIPEKIVREKEGRKYDERGGYKHLLVMKVDMI